MNLASSRVNVQGNPREIESIDALPAKFTRFAQTEEVQGDF